MRGSIRSARDAGNILLDPSLGTHTHSTLQGCQSLGYREANLGAVYVGSSGEREALGVQTVKMWSKMWPTNVVKCVT